MRILFVSNSPLAATGYGVQSRLFVPRIRDMGHDVSILAFYGLEGGVLDWGGIRMYPRAVHPYGQDAVRGTAEYVNADIVLSLMDAWVCEPKRYPDVRHVLWFPVDMAPLPDAVKHVAERAFTRIVMSRFGERMVNDAGLDCLYVPHGCFDYEAPVTVSFGHSEKLGDIVTEKVDVNSVIGIDEHGNRVQSSILKRHIIPLRDSFAIAVKTKSGRSFKITRDNKILTDKGWTPAGSLKAGDYIIIGDVITVDGGTNETALDSGRTRLASCELRDSAKVSNNGEIPRSNLVRDSYAGATHTRVIPKHGGEFSTAITSEERDDAGGIGLSRRDNRRRGSHNHYQEQSDIPAWNKIRSLHAESGSVESVRGTDLLDDRTNPMDASRPSTGHVGLGLGLSSSISGIQRQGTVRSDTAVFGSQEETGILDDSILRNAHVSEGCTTSSTRRIGSLERDTAVERQTRAFPRDEITSLIPVYLETVYDLTTETGNFLVSGAIVHNCETDVYKPMDKQAARLKIDPTGQLRDRFIVGMVAANKGNAPSRKAWPQQIRAFAEFARSHPEALLYCHTTAGSQFGGVNLYEYATHCGLEIGRNIVFCDQFHNHLGFPDEYMVDTYNAMDVLLSVSMGEGFGVPILEAQACGVPVIVGDWTAMSELCFAGWKVTKDDATEYPIPMMGHTSVQWLPSVEGIRRQLQTAWVCLRKGEADTMRQQARTGALAYDADYVTETYWKPALKQIAKQVDGHKAMLLRQARKPVEVEASS